MREGDKGEPDPLGMSGDEGVSQIRRKWVEVFTGVNQDVRDMQDPLRIELEW